MKIDKKNGNVCFNDEFHRYWDTTDENKKYVSVTTLIHSYTQDFDKDFWSKYKALEKLIPKDSWALEKKSLLGTHKFNKEILEIYNISEDEFNKAQQDILDEWDRKNKESCERGTKIHAELENSFYGANRSQTLKKFGIGGKFDCKKNYSELDLEHAVYPEYLISRDSADGKLHLAGQIDVLIKDGLNIIISDWKGLPIDTEIPTIDGWSTIADLQEGDIIFDKNGNPTRIIHKSKLHMNPCYQITFDNGDKITADHEHRWEVTFKKGKNKSHPDGLYNVVMTTEELCDYLEKLGEKPSATLIPKIYNPKPLNLPKQRLPIDPYVLGVWLGDETKAAGSITQMKGSKVWGEIKKRGYTIGENGQHNPDRENVEVRTIYGLRSTLRVLNLLKNKHIPNNYQRASYEQRLDLLRGLMDTDGYYNAERKRFVMSTSQIWQRDDLVKLLSTLGVKSTVFSVIKKLDGKKFQTWDVCFSTTEFNPFLVRNQDIDINLKFNRRTFRNIVKVEKVDTVQTQCLEVDSPTHTFLCTNKMIVTHNTNQKIDLKGGFNTLTHSAAKMKYPLNNLDDCNFNHYQLQLSTYAWMLQKINPDFKIQKLYLYHIDHNNKETLYECQYLKKEVERMLVDYRKKLIQEEQRNKRKPIEY